MGMHKITEETVSVNLARDDMRLLHQALNEVCSGVGFTDEEFATRLGTSRAEADILLKVLSLTYRRFEASRREGSA